MEDLLNVGYVSGLHGYNGDIKIKLNHDHQIDLEAITKKTRKDKSGNLFLFIELIGKPVPFCIESISSPGNNRVVIKLEDINSTNQAEMLIRKAVFVPKHWRTRKENNDSDYHELHGFNIIDKVKGSLGTIEEILEIPMQNIVKITMKGTEVLIPLNEETVINIDHENQTIYIDTPEGLLDVYLDK